MAKVSNRFMNPGSRSRYVQRVPAEYNCTGTVFEKPQGGGVAAMWIHLKTEDGRTFEVELSNEEIDRLISVRADSFNRYGRA